MFGLFKKSPSTEGKAKMSVNADVEIYYWTTCPFCRRALALLDAKGVNYKRHDITGDEAAREQMAVRTGGPKSVPQIFINNEHIGGCDDLHALDDKGELDGLLEKAA